MDDYNAQVAESAVIGAILQDNTALPRLLPLVKPDQFSIATYRQLFELFLEMDSQKMPIDVVTVAERLMLDSAIRIPVETLNRCADSTANFQNVTEYAGSIVEKWKLRQMAAALSDASSSLKEGDLQGAIATVQDKVIELQAQSGAESITIGEMMVNFFTDIEAIMRDPELGGKNFLRTGFYDFDSQFGGLSVGLNIVAGRPAMGKTAFSLCLSRQVAEREKTVLFFSYEMSERQLRRRYASSRTGVDSSRLDHAQISEDEIGKLVNAVDEASKLDVHLFCPENTDVDNLIGMIESWRLINGRSPDLVVIDHLVLLSCKNAGKRHDELSIICRKLRSYFVGKIDRPCLLLTQLSRGLEQRTNKRPMQADLRESGTIEEEATMIIGLYRDEVYNPDTPDQGIAEVWTLKNRENPTGMIKLWWVPETTTFLNMAN